MGEIEHVSYFLLEFLFTIPNMSLFVVDNRNYIAMVDVVEAGKANPEDKSGDDRLEGTGLPLLGHEQEQEKIPGGPRVRVEDVGPGEDSVQQLLERERQKLRQRRLEATPTGRSLADDLPAGLVGGQRGAVAAPVLRPLGEDLPDGAVGGRLPGPPIGSSPARPVGAVKPSGVKWAFTARPLLTKEDKFGK